MKTFGCVLMGSFLSVLALGCNGAGDPITRIESQYTSTVNAVCAACPAASGTTTEAECRALADENNPFMGPEFECQRSAYHMYPNELGPLYNCQADVLVRYDGCIRGAVRTCPPTDTALMTCNDQLNADTRACPLPDSVAAGTAVSNCFNP
jgi:hypothetical protein